MLVNRLKRGAYHLETKGCGFGWGVSGTPISGRVGRKFPIPGYNVIFAGKGRDPHPLRNFFPCAFTQNFLYTKLFQGGYVVHH